MQIDQNDTIGSRTVHAYFPEYPGQTVRFRLGKGERHPVRTAVATEFTMYLGDGGRGSIQLPAPKGHYYIYTVTGPDGLTATGGLTASEGAMSLYTWVGLGGSDYLFAANNLSDLVSAAAAQLNLSLLPGTHVLAYYAALDDLGLLTNTIGAADKLPYMDEADGFALATFTAFARSFVAAVDKAAARAVLDVPETGDVPTALADLDTTVTGAQLDADHATIGGLGAVASTNLATNSGLGISGTDLALGTPSTLTASTSNAVTTSAHSHAITTTSNANATPSTILVSDSDGDISVNRLGVGGNESTAYRAYFYERSYDTSGEIINNYNYMLATPTSATSANYYAFYNRSLLAENYSYTGAATAIFALIDFRGDSITNLYGSQIVVTCNNGTHTPSATNLYGHHIEVGSGLFDSIANAYGIYIKNVNTATNNYALYTNGGLVHFGDRVEITQPSSTAAKPVLQLTQNDVDEPAIKIIGTAAAADLTRTIVAEADVTTATRAGFVKVEVQDDGNQIADQDYYMPVYTLA